jgi:hypothetical protein
MLNLRSPPRDKSVALRKELNQWPFFASQCAFIRESINQDVLIENEIDESSTLDNFFVKGEHHEDQPITNIGVVIILRGQ